MNVSTRINPPRGRLKYRKNSKWITIPISIASSCDVDILGLFPSAICVFWAVLGKVAELSTSETSQITPIPVRLLLLEGCSLHMLVERGLEVPFVLA
jgi:hypothetical protein